MPWGRASARLPRFRAAQMKSRASKKQSLLNYTLARGWNLIGEDEWHDLRTNLPDISEITIRNSGIPITAPWSGVKTHSPDQLEVALCEFTHVYETRPDLRRYCRNQVIAAKDRAR